MLKIFDDSANACMRNPERIWIKIQNRIDDDGILGMRIMHDIGKGIGVAVKEVSNRYHGKLCG